MGVVRMTILAPPMAFGERPPGRHLYEVNEFEIALALTKWRVLRDIADQLPERPIGHSGRHHDFPPVVMLLFGVMRWGLHGEAATHRMFSHHNFWEPLRQQLASEYTSYPVLKDPSAFPTRFMFARFCKRNSLDAQTFAAIVEQFRFSMLRVALRVGMFAEEDVSWTHPPLYNLLTGDGTVVRPMYHRIRSGKRHEKDAESFGVGGRKKPVAGLKFGTVEGWIRGYDERLILELFSVQHGDGRDEGAMAMAYARWLKQRTPGFQGLVWDMALRGAHRRLGYEMGILVITKSPRAAGGGPKIVKMPDFVTLRNNGKIERIPLWTYEGAPCIRIPGPLASSYEYIPLQRLRIRVRENKGSFAWYGEYIIPKEAPSPLRMRGAAIRLRLDGSPAEDKKGFKREENLHAIPMRVHPSSVLHDDSNNLDPIWRDLYRLRPRAEAMMSWFKARMHHRRAPGIGRDRVHLKMLNGALYNNVKMLIRYSKRTGIPMEDILNY